MYKTPEKVSRAVETGLEWVAKAQQNNGGWGAGTHSRQDITDPHAVQTDPATTAMVSMAILRSGSTLTSGKYSSQLRKAVEYLLESVEKSSPNSTNITSQTGTQIQVKLGQNIDVALTAQFFSNLMDYPFHETTMKERVKKDLDICVKKIQNAQDADGSMKGAGWAGVLQSAYANNALESAQARGAKVDTVALRKSRSYQKGNYDANTGEVKTDMAAGVMLYSVASSNRASAKEARIVDEEFKKAKREGKLKPDDKVTAENMEKIGYSKSQAMNLATSYNVYESSKSVASNSSVMSGFGSNGGEEFLSYLQTGESMIIKKDSDWKKWYDNMSGKLLSIQNNEGSWSGHHCITSPVFCTATCVLILTVNNDINKLVAMGGK
jgi:hypothetical protein